MSSLIISFEIIMPMCLLLLTGRLLRRVNLLGADTTQALNKLVSTVFLPCLLFINMYNSDLKRTFNARLFWYAIAGVVVSYALLMLLVPRFEKDNRRRAVMIHALFRGNTAIFGIPLAQGIVGADGNIDDLIVVMSVMIILYNILGVLTLQVFGESRSNVGSVLKGIATSPMIIGGILGLVLALLELRLPDLIVTPVSSLAAITAPIAFLSLGASFNLSASRHNRRYISAVIVIRLVIMPLVWVVGGALLLGFRGGAVAALIAVFATPTAVNTYPLAAAANADEELAGELVVFTTICSILTLFLLILGLKSFDIV